MHKIIVRPAIAAALSAVLCAAATLSNAQPAAPAAAPDPNQEIVQVSTINALIKGLYDGDTSMGDLLKMGSFGIGTLNQLDGEMLAIDGIAYQVTSDGKVHVVPPTAKTPFAAVTNFHADATSTGITAQSFEALQAEIDKGLTSENYFYAIRVTGNIPVMKVRSVERQQRPYRPLTEVVRSQSVFTYENTSGTLVGFRCPDFVQGVNVADYHLHFLSADKTQGGHVLGFELKDGKVETDTLPQFRMLLPATQAFRQADLSEKNEAAIHAVETLRAPAK